MIMQCLYMPLCKDLTFIYIAFVRMGTSGIDNICIFTILAPELVDF